MMPVGGVSAAEAVVTVVTVAAVTQVPSVTAMAVEAALLTETSMVASVPTLQTSRRPWVTPPPDDGGPSANDGGLVPGSTVEVGLGPHAVVAAAAKSVRMGTCRVGRIECPRGG